MSLSTTSNNDANEQHQPSSKANSLMKKVFPDWSTYSEVRTKSAFVVRCYMVGTFYGMLFGAGIPASPLLYKTFQSNAGAQFNIIFTFTLLGFFCSAVPYALFLDNAPKPPPTCLQLKKIESSSNNNNNQNDENIISHHHRSEKQKDYSRTWAPQFKSVFSPLWLGLSCWIGGHMYYPGRFVLEFEEKKTRFREFARLTCKTAVALHRVHLPFAMGWSLFFGLMCYPLRKPHYKYDDTFNNDDSLILLEAKAGLPSTLEEEEKKGNNKN